MKLAIADPPYPPLRQAGGQKRRASRWYSTANPVAASDKQADNHPDAAEWDDPARHRQLLEELVAGYDGWAIATTPDGIAAYGKLPVECRLMAWVRPNAAPGAHRLHAKWEAVIVYPPVGRRSNRNGAGSVPNVLTADAPRASLAPSQKRGRAGCWMRWATTLPLMKCATCSTAVAW